MSAKPILAKNIKNTMLQHNVTNNVSISRLQIALW